MQPTITGRNLTGLTNATAVIAPEKMPAAPMPESALPTTRAADPGATPDTREPSSKMAKATRNSTFTGTME